MSHYNAVSFYFNIKLTYNFYTMLDFPGSTVLELYGIAFRTYKTLSINLMIRADV